MYKAKMNSLALRHKEGFEVLLPGCGGFREMDIVDGRCSLVPRYKNTVNHLPSNQQSLLLVSAVGRWVNAWSPLTIATTFSVNQTDFLN